MLGSHYQQKMQTAEEDFQWESLIQYEYIDWNDIVEAEMSGDPEALSLLKSKSKEVKRAKSLGHQNDECISAHSPLATPSYAQIAQHGIKRATSDRVSLSPIDFHPKRSMYSRLEVWTSEGTPTSLYNSEAIPEERTPDADNQYNAYNSRAVQRRLFSSPKIDQQNTVGVSITKSPRQVEELTAHRVNQRQKQIDFGKNTIGYQKYIQTVPRWQRKPSDPVTPDKHKPVSTRAWQGQIRLWRKALHAFDSPVEDTFTSDEAALCEM